MANRITYYFSEKQALNRYVYCPATKTYTHEPGYHVFKGVDNQKYNVTEVTYGNKHPIGAYDDMKMVYINTNGVDLRYSQTMLLIKEETLKEPVIETTLRHRQISDAV